MMSKLKPGDIIKFDIIDKHYTSEGLAVGGVSRVSNEQLIVYQSIDLENFPSFSDFKGSSVTLNHGDYGLVIKKIGRPWRLNQDNERWRMYDVYEVFTTKLSMCQVFKFNLEKVL